MVRLWFQGGEECGITLLWEWLPSKLKPGMVVPDIVTSIDQIDLFVIIFWFWTLLIQCFFSRDQIFTWFRTGSKSHQAPLPHGIDKHILTLRISILFFVQIDSKNGWASSHDFWVREFLSRICNTHSSRIVSRLLNPAAEIFHWMLKL